MNKQDMIYEYGDELYFFLLKRAGNERMAKDVYQNTLLKAYENSNQLDKEGKRRAWLFQIARHELADYYNRENRYVEQFEQSLDPVMKNEEDDNFSEMFCCFNDFVNNLPEKYKVVVEQVYIKGKTQIETAQKLNLSLPNVKARIRRAKAMLKTQFIECCQYELDRQGKLIGEADCIKCHGIIKAKADST